MGTDIHFYVEKREYRFDDTDRKNGIWVTADKWTRNEYSLLYPEYSDEPDWVVDNLDSFYGERNYLLFSIFANVRNTMRQYPIPPISMPKGLPNDVTSEVKAVSDSEGPDGHSHSWFTLLELLNFDWQKSFKCLCVDENGNKKLKNYTYSECCRMFLTEVLPKLEILGEPDNVRIVFWFDN